jgi:hypothetical protein
MNTQRCARLALAVPVVYLVLLAALHGLEPEINPSRRLISEYALGPFGW